MPAFLLVFAVFVGIMALAFNTEIQSSKDRKEICSLLQGEMVSPDICVKKDSTLRKW